MRNAAATRTSKNRGYDNRLVRRYSLSTLVVIEWITGQYRVGVRRQLVTPTAEVLDLSMGGMLVEAPGQPELEVNSPVELASDGDRATARVAHKHVALSPDKQLLGIEFVTMSEGFEAGLHALLLALRR